VRAKGFIVLVGVLLTGFVAAWPFRQGPEAPAPSAALVVDVPLRRSEPALAALPPTSDSPATDLTAFDAATLDAAAAADEPSIDFTSDDPLAENRSGARHRHELDAIATTPYLPDGFSRLANADARNRLIAGPAEAAAQGRNWRPVRLKLPTPKALRRHRITDGDSLESLAQRYLGQAERAAEIYALNGDILAAPDLLPLGRIIRIPPAEE
jgi:nucleoid-associated protein YgaU